MHRTISATAVASLTILAAVTLTALARAEVSDHLMCYQIKDPVKLAGIVDLDAPRLGAENGCKLAQAQFFCVAVTKTVISAQDKVTGLPITPLPVTGPDPGDRLCYKLTCPAPFPPGTPETDQFGTRTIAKFKTVTLCAPAVKGTPIPPTPTPTPRFVANGDGTVIDNQTGLQWEQKDTVWSSANLADPHDVYNRYTWSLYESDVLPDGTAFTDFLVRLNTTPCFAGQCDWRLPTIQELQSIVDLGASGCGSESLPCIDPIFGPTAAHNTYYWSATTGSFGDFAWFVNFSNGLAADFFKTTPSAVRAVRAD